MCQAGRQPRANRGGIIDDGISMMVGIGCVMDVFPGPHQRKNKRGCMGACAEDGQCGRPRTGPKPVPVQSKLSPAGRKPVPRPLWEGQAQHSTGSRVVRVRQPSHLCRQSRRTCTLDTTRLYSPQTRHLHRWTSIASPLSLFRLCLRCLCILRRPDVDTQRRPTRFIVYLVLAPHSNVAIHIAAPLPVQFPRRLLALCRPLVSLPLDCLATTSA